MKILLINRGFKWRGFVGDGIEPIPHLLVISAEKTCKEKLWIYRAYLKTNYDAFSKVTQYEQNRNII